MSGPLSSDLQAAIQRKTGGVVSQSLVWNRATLRLLAATGDSDGEPAVLRWLERFGRSVSLSVLADCLAGAGESPAAALELFLREVDASDFALEDWSKALEALLAYLARENRNSSPAALFGYLQCTSEFASHSGSPDSLADTVEKMLAEYGFEGSEGCASGETAS